MGKSKKVVAVLVDLKAVFDSVDRGILGRRLREERVSYKLRKRIREIYEETKNVIRVGERCGKRFWTCKGVRQGCSLSQMLFNVLVANMEKELEKEGVGGIKIGREKLRMLEYADDIIILAEEEEVLEGNNKLECGAVKYIILLCACVAQFSYNQVDFRLLLRLLDLRRRLYLC